MSGKSKVTGAGAGGRGFRRTGAQPGASRRGAFIVYTDGPVSIGETLIRMRWKLAIVAAAIITGAVVIYSLQVGSNAKPILIGKPENSKNRIVEADVFRAPQIVYDFLDADTVEAKLGCVRDAAAHGDSVRKFYEARDSVRDVYRAVQPAESGHLHDAIRVERFYVELDEHVRVVAVVAMEHGFKIDWPAFTQLNPVSPESLLSGENVSGEFRVSISDLEYYAGEFADDKKFQSFRIESEDLAKPVTVYALRQSVAERALSLYSGPVPLRCVLSLSVGTPGSKESSQLTVNALTARGWILP
jgi:hypothetical protein